LGRKLFVFEFGISLLQLRHQIVPPDLLVGSQCIDRGFLLRDAGSVESLQLPDKEQVGDLLDGDERVRETGGPE